MNDMTIIVSPSLNRDGRLDYSGRGPLFDARVDGRVIVTRSTTPFCDTARALLVEGMPPDTIIMMRHGYDGCDALRSTVGYAAGMTVSEKPTFNKWSPHPHYDASSAVPGTAPVRETEVVATLVAA